DYPHTKKLLYGSPTSAHMLLDKLARTCATYLEAQVAAGVDAVQIFDSWGGIVSPGDFREFPLRYAKRVIEMLRASPTFKTRNVPIIYFVNGCAPYLTDYASSGADVLGVDWRIGIDQVRRGVGDGVALQGNLDPGALFATPAEIRTRVADILASAGPIGHIFNLGHGVLPDTDPEHVRAMVSAVKELSARP
ncbi:MAG TPA: uroporphyrinogen decarboxylase family protein, partial [Kofleriaceae bacterium]